MTSVSKEHERTSSLHDSLQLAEEGQRNYDDEFSQLQDDILREESAQIEQFIDEIHAPDNSSDDERSQLPRV